MNRSRDYYRHHRERAIQRKKGIARRYWHYNHDGQYSKGKIHCSCRMCSSKTNTDGWAMSDMRRLACGA